MSSDVVNPIEHLAIDLMSANELAELLRGAARLFAGDITVEQSVDPEYPAAVYVVIRVALAEPRPGIEEIINCELAWHREAAQIAPLARGLVRLLVE